MSYPEDGRNLTLARKLYDNQAVVICTHNWGEVRAGVGGGGAYFSKVDFLI